ncbi:HNH endonuclease, partial [Anaerotruncus colihominis]|uniref:HNH endonuclease n=1 Tax=Anaerotruncus colihominis TaxID=169435 RepID=UPI003AB81ACA
QLTCVKCTRSSLVDVVSLLGNKSEVFIRQSLHKATRCAICGGYLHIHSISIDHIQRKREGGTGSADNGQLTHPYCNTGIKN